MATVGPPKLVRHPVTDGPLFTLVRKLEQRVSGPEPDTWLSKAAVVSVTVSETEAWCIYANGTVDKTTDFALQTPGPALAVSHAVFDKLGELLWAIAERRPRVQWCRPGKGPRREFTLVGVKSRGTRCPFIPCQDRVFDGFDARMLYLQSVIVGLLA